MVDRNEQAPAPQAPRRASPGERLRAARERKGITLVDAADVLHLDRWLLEALERDNFSALGAPVFAKGHLRKYAALVGEPIDDILLAYHQCEGVHELPPLLDRASILRPASPPSRGVPAAAIFGLLLAFGAAGVWWWYEQPVERPTPIGALSRTGALAAAAIEPGADPAEQGTEGPALTLDADLVETANARDSGLRSPDTSGAAGSAPATAAPAASGAGVGGASGTAPSAAPITTPAAARLTPAATVAAAPPASPAPARVAAASPPGASATAGASPANAAEHMLTLAFDADSWVEVRDGGGARLYYGLGAGGSRRNLRGAPPFEVFLGRYADVHVALDGEQRDIPGDSVRGNTARFTIEPR